MRQHTYWFVVGAIWEEEAGWVKDEFNCQQCSPVTVAGLVKCAMRISTNNVLGVPSRLVECPPFHAYRQHVHLNV